MDNFSCKKCSRPVWPAYAEKSDGLCSICWKQIHVIGVCNEAERREMVASEQIMEFLTSCEDRCLFDCCGLDAITVTEEKLNAWVSNLKQEDLNVFKKDVLQLKKCVDESSIPVRFLGSKLTVEEFYRVMQPLMNLASWAG